MQRTGNVEREGRGTKSMWETAAVRLRPALALVVVFGSACTGIVTGEGVPADEHEQHGPDDRARHTAP
jgi:hypothetical protein